jgi:short-subunit dehydrogenase
VITARRKSIDRLAQEFPEGESCLVRELDVTNDLQIIHVISEIFQKWRSIDVLINNAGISFRSTLEHMDEQTELVQLHTNYLGPMSLIRAVLPGMRERGSGRIINISSMSGMMAMPTMGSYGASKAALESASEALWYEMKPFGVGVSIVQPGFVHSESFRNVYFSKKGQLSEALGGPYSIYYKSLAPFVARFMKFSKVTPQKIAKRIFNLAQSRRPPLWVPVTFDAYFFRLLKRLIPSFWFYNFIFSLLPYSSKWGVKYPNPKAPLPVWPPKVST